jgi:HAD superfamily hydrolase (TIGR01509 family)
VSNRHLPIEALVFDFDGLILETEEADYRAWQELFQAEGSDLPLEVWVECIGRDANFFDPIAYFQERTGRTLQREGALAEQKARKLELVHAQSIMPGVRDYLEAARRWGIKLGIASSSSRRWVLGHLDRLGLADGWNAIRCRDDVPHAKPAPDLYLAVLEGLKVKAPAAIAFEDSPNGIRAAKLAGLKCVAVPNMMTAGLDLTGADLILGSLSEMPLDQLIRKLASPD